MPFNKPSEFFNVVDPDGSNNFIQNIDFVEGAGIDYNTTYDPLTQRFDLEVNSLVTQYDNQNAIDAMDGVFQDTSTIDFTYGYYDGHLETITADVIQTNLDHTQLQDIGVNTHTQIDNHISNTSNPHNTTKAQIGLGNVENTALSTWAGGSSIVSIGTLSSGTVPTSLLSGIVPINRGGTNLSSTPTNGQLLIGNGTGYTLGTLTLSGGLGISYTPAGNITLSYTGTPSSYWDDDGGIPSILPIASGSKSFSIGSGAAAYNSSGFALGTGTRTLDNGVGATRTGCNLSIGSAISNVGSTIARVDNRFAQSLSMGLVRFNGSATNGLNTILPSRNQSLVIGSVEGRNAFQSVRCLKSSGIVISALNEPSLNQNLLIGTGSQGTVIGKNSGSFLYSLNTNDTITDNQIILGNDIKLVDNAATITTFIGNNITKSTIGSAGTNIVLGTPSISSNIPGIGNNSKVESGNIPIGTNCSGSDIASGLINFITSHYNSQSQSSINNQSYFYRGMGTIGTAASSSQFQDLPVPINSTWVFKVLINTKASTANNIGAGFLITGVVKRGSSGNAVLINSTKTILGRDNTNFDTSVSVSSSNLRFTVNNTNSVSILWSICIEITETKVI